MSDEKRCSKCGVYKSPANFNRKVGHKNDLASRCRECAQAVQAIYRDANREALREKNRAYAALHPKPKKEPKPRAEHLSAKKRAEMTPAELEFVRARDRAKRLANPERYRGYSRQSRKNRQADIGSRLNRWTQENRSLRRSVRVERVNIVRLIDRDRGVCGICGDQVGPGEQSIDHIIPITLGGEDSYANTQLAHKLCNVSKGNRLQAERRPF